MTSMVILLISALCLILALLGKKIRDWLTESLRPHEAIRPYQWAKTEQHDTQ